LHCSNAAFGGKVMEPTLAADILPDVLGKIHARRKTAEEPLIITVDTREQAPWTFERLNVITTRGTLNVGDYRTEGTAFVIERKSGPDFLSTITWGRERFERELARMREAGGGVIVVEASLAELLYGPDNRRGQRVHPNSIMGTVAAFQARYGVPTLFGGTRDLAERLAYHLLRQAARQAAESAEATATTEQEAECSIERT